MSVSFVRMKYAGLMSIIMVSFIEARKQERKKKNKPRQIFCGTGDGKYRCRP